MCFRFAKYINSHSEMGCCKKICAWLILVLLTATITIGVLSATYYKDKWSAVWVNVIAAECEPNCELESCLVSCDMYVSYNCHSELVYLNFTSNTMDRTYQAGDKLHMDRKNNDCTLELDDQTPLGTLFLYICVGGLFLLLLGGSLVGAVVFVYRGKLNFYEHSTEDDANTPLKKVSVINYHSHSDGKYEMPHIHF